MTWRSATMLALLPSLLACTIDKPAALGRVCGGNAACGPGAVCDPIKGRCVTETAGDASAPDTVGPAADLAPDGPTADGSVVDQTTPDQAGADGLVTDLAVASCAPDLDVVITEVSLEVDPHVSLSTRSLGGAAVGDFRLVIVTNEDQLDHPLASATTIAPLSTLRIVGESPAPGEIGVGQPLPLETEGESVAVALYDAQDRLVDYVAIGAKALAAPAGVTFVGGTVVVPGDFVAADSFFSRVKQEGSCPTLRAADWAVEPRIP